ncbi:hypothetical protein SAMN00790413_04413 [Deinococcus hopiensis KR-140]|uniref:Uncharacterized protein n=1 Tax=Deinococcus hopiensis KR-140 TaxID=695939 RepID=A0A1W1UQT4_9DEIO|nr:hypothetical protein SAMN00790413_04413 [Deinococcus hopiensis KR-140]
MQANRPIGHHGDQVIDDSNVPLKSLRHLRSLGFLYFQICHSLLAFSSSV